MADQLELSVDVPERLGEQLATALGIDVVTTQLGAHLRAGLLGSQERLELLERDAEQVLQAHDLPDSLHLGLGVDAVLAGWSRRGLGQKPDLLVVADRAGG